MDTILFFDLEMNKDNKVVDAGAVLGEAQWHDRNPDQWVGFFAQAEFVAGHNIVSHDLPILLDLYKELKINDLYVIDTLFWSPLLFPKKPYHRLIKDYKLQEEEINNPLTDALMSRIVFQDELAAFLKLDKDFRQILYQLLGREKGFAGLFAYLDWAPALVDLEALIAERFEGAICAQANLAQYISEYPVELAYSLAIIGAGSPDSVTPAWVYRTFPQVSRVIHGLRSVPCLPGCAYCDLRLDAQKGLKEFFGYDDFRTFDGKPLQKEGVELALKNKSLVAVFPTGGGKSLTFQVPALMSGRNVGGLTVVISPLQSLMKDQVDNLEKSGITNAVTINGLLDPIERAKSIERVENGSAWLLYISPESLRSRTISKLIEKRKVVRFVIDEAHCFSSWGQDFRVDYLFIGDFIKQLQERKQLAEPIPVSCFTATAKPNVIADIQAYFKEKLSLELTLIQAKSGRVNLHYDVLPQKNEDDKYRELRRLIKTKNCPTIVYVSRTRKASELAEKLVQDGFDARPFHGKMEAKAKTKNQDDFISGEVQVMVATSAFGMGVDKKDVQLVVHYEISNSLENYVQEAGRAGRDPHLDADCFVLFDEEDLHKHFVLLNQTKINLKEIQEIWSSIKQLTKFRKSIKGSALEIARQAGWNEATTEMETKVRTAINALEQAGLLVRGENSPRVYANSIAVPSAQAAIDKINNSNRFSSRQRTHAIRIIKKLISAKQRSRSDDDGEERVDYISDSLGIVKGDVIEAIELMRREGILGQANDLQAFIKRAQGQKKIEKDVGEYAKIENFIASNLEYGAQQVNLKDWAEKAEDAGVKEFDIVKAKAILNLWAILGYIKKSVIAQTDHHLNLQLLYPKSEFETLLKKKQNITGFAVKYLWDEALRQNSDSKDPTLFVDFSLLALEKAYKELFKIDITPRDVRDSLFYLSRIGAIKIEGGFLVIYNRMSIERKEENNKVRYKKIDYKKLEQFYESKVQQVHIVGEYAKKMIKDYKEALQFVNDYFSLNYSSFLSKYFNGEQIEDMSRSITPRKFQELIGDLSAAQVAIVKDNVSAKIAVLAGPGSGKTKTLVHKLTSLLLLEDVKYEQLLMLTFSRAAATEFKKRLFALLGGGAAFVEIKTFHSYCFDLIGKVGNLESADNVFAQAIEKIKNREIEVSQIAKSVLVIDEGQDISSEEYALILELINFNEEMRVIIVGDDDQNIFSFRGSDAKYLRQFVESEGAKSYELLENYRSKANIVEFANQFVLKINHRLKSLPCQPVQKENGRITLFTYRSTGLIVPLVSELVKAELTGSTCVLTQTNEQSELVLSLLKINGLQAKLVQTNDHFNLLDLREIRFFTDFIGKKIEGDYIDKETWQEAKRALNSQYKTSPNFHFIKQLVRDYQDTNPKNKHLASLKTFIQESRIEDFLVADQEMIYVSTMHKAKGKEFDNVIILLDNYDLSDDEAKRLVYVAMTRAKNNLTIHTNGSYLNGIEVPGLVRKSSDHLYQTPRELVYFTSLKDVHLGFFKQHQILISKLEAGMELQPVADGLAYKGQQVLKYSKSFMQRLQGRSRKKYRPQRAVVNHLVYWRDKNEVPETFEQIIGGELVVQTVNPEILVVLVEIWLVRDVGGSRENS